ncbi:DUF7688 family protein [Duganella vulcania]|uniref:DUF7688 domain-containing protein n=1 Tax=Duganella vulcania TaxID=2692166 RepID=A0A845GIQ3_9BURK|nr:hypothetical protein [Duganella vulcania]MYM92549.1 hypothetical protein [Duganella vulcania]
MAIFDNVLLTHEVRMNGATLVSGDETSVSVIFYNLTGRNFSRPEPWRTGTHADYLAMMERDWKVSFSGALIELAKVGQTAVESHQFD